MPHMYILECIDGSYYTGSTWDLARRLSEHQSGVGANFTAKRLPVKLVYCEYYDRVDDAFYREKQVQGWSRRKKQALIEGNKEKLVEYSRNYTQYPPVASTSSATGSASSLSSAARGADAVPLPELVEGSAASPDSAYPSVASTSSATGDASSLSSATGDASSLSSATGGAMPLPELVEGSGGKIGYGE
jgi:putative endonuclease